MRVGSLTAAHLFDGIGGFHIAADRAGMETLWVSEIDPKASAVLDHHWPAVKNLGDVHGITDAPGVDVLTGGFPCQDYSVAGNRGGLAGDRGALWWEYHRLITELRPTWVVGENVPGLLSSRDGADFETIVGSLTECGYGVAWAVLDAQYFGVAQRRRRVFIVGHIGGTPRPEVLALSEGLFGHPEPRRETGEKVAALTTNGLGGGGPDDNLAQGGHLIAFDWQAGGDGTSSGAFNADGSTPTLGTVGRLAFALQGTTIGRSDEAGPGGKGWDDSGGMFTLETIAPHGVASPSSVRRLTPVECERLQGFPDGWTDIPGNSDTQRYRQLGNAVAVPVVEWLLKRIGDI